MKRTLNLVNTLALLATVAINYLSNTGMIGGNTMETISDRYANYFTPAGYAFSIWGLIYLGLAAFVIYSWRSDREQNNSVTGKIGWWFVASCVANSLWVVAWLNDQLAISVLLMVLLFVSLLKIVLNVGVGKGGRSSKESMFVHWPFAIYFGWVSVAMIANLAAYLTKLGWDGWGLSGVSWTIIMISIAGLVNIGVILNRKIQAFGLVGIWAVLAIAMSNKDNGTADAVVTTCYVVAAVIAVFIAISLFIKNSGRAGSTALEA